MISTQFKFEDIFGEFIDKDSISLEQITELNRLLTEIMSILIFV